MSDSRSNAYGPIDPHNPNFWAPPPNLVHATYQLDFDRPYLVDTIKIQWKVPPPTVEISLHSIIDGWRIMLKEKPEEHIDLNFIPIEIIGVKILMMDLD
jgi:hypothetical protein